MSLAGLILGCVIAALPIEVTEESETLLKGPIHNGGFGGPVVKVGSLAGQTGIFVGGRGGWIINHAFVIGGGGYGLANQDMEVTPRGLSGQNLPGEYRLEMGYGGLELEYVHRSRKVVHASIQALIGGGTAGYRDRDWERTYESDAFFVAEPGINLELNVSRPFRVGVGGAWRFVSGFEMASLPDLTDDDLSGFAGVLTFKFGSF